MNKENDRQDILHDNGGNLLNRDIWYETKDPDFIDISMKSMVASNWMSYERVLEGPYANSPIKPINNYVQNIATEPTLVGIFNNIIKLRFHLYADMYLLKKPDEDLVHVDRTWIRQYYLTDYQMPVREDCFPETFKFYVPWFLEDSPNFKILNSEEESPFLVLEGPSSFPLPPKGHRGLVSPAFVVFQIKKTGKRWQDEELGIPRRGDPIFDLEIPVSDIILERVRKHYAKD